MWKKEKKRKETNLNIHIILQRSTQYSVYQNLSSVDLEH